MSRLMLSFVIGLGAGLVDILPMLARKMPRRALVSAFLQYFFVSVVIVNIDLPGIEWWLEGGLIALALASPIIVMVTEKEKGAGFVIGGTAVILGTLIGIAGHCLA